MTSTTFHPPSFYDVVTLAILHDRPGMQRRTFPQALSVLRARVVHELGTQRRVRLTVRRAEFDGRTWLQAEDAGPYIPR